MQEGGLIRNVPEKPSQSLAELEALRDRILSDLRLGKQAAGYKAARKALDRFIREVSDD